MRESTQDIDMTDDNPLSSTEVLVTRGGAQQLELFEAEEIVRPDYNIGKYATILFASPYLKTLADSRRIEWKTKAPDGKSDAQAAISITPLLGQIVPTTTTFKLFMGIIQIWRMQGSRPSGEVLFSDRQLAEVCGWHWTGKIGKRIREHLDILQGTSIDWELAFQTKERTERRVQKMHMIEEATHIDRHLAFGQERFTANHVVRINPALVANMLANKVRPLNFETLRQISGDASMRLYMMLDMYLASKTHWERRAEPLLKDDLGYEGKRYDNRGERKRTLQRLIDDLDGKELASGKVSLELAETADKRDWKIVARKTKRIEKKRPHVKQLMPSKDAEFLADDLLALFDGVPKAGAPKRGFMVFLCRHYPEHLLRDAISRAKADYLGNVRKSVGAIFRYELEMLVRGRGDLTWYKDTN